MNFIVKNGPFIKTKNDKLSIEAVTFISLIPFLIYRIILNPVNNLIILILLLLSTLPLSIFIDYIKNKKINIMDYINDLNYVLIMSILVPINIPYELIFTCNIVLIILSKFIDFINYKSLLIFIIFIYFQFINKNYILSDYNIYLYLIIYIKELLNLELYYYLY